MCCSSVTADGREEETMNAIGGQFFHNEQSTFWLFINAGLLLGYTLGHKHLLSWILI